MLLRVVGCCCLLVGAFAKDKTCSVTTDNCLDISEFDLIKSIRWGCPKGNHDAKCAVTRISQIEEWLNHHGKYRILVTGKMGSGKTTFIRGLTEKFVPPTDSLLPHTTKVMPYGHYHEGSNCVFFDTPGLKDNEESSNDYDYLREMVRKNGEPNLLLFAIKMDDFVFQDEDIEAMVNITSAFGWKIWHRAMFILTFANMVQKVGHAPDSVENKLYFSSIFDRRHLDIVEALRRSSVKEDVIDDIHVVPVGLVSQPKILADRRDVSWIDEFWQEAFKILRKTQGSYTAPKEWTDNRNRAEKTQGSYTAPKEWTDNPKRAEKMKEENKPACNVEEPTLIIYIFIIWFFIASILAICFIIGMCMTCCEQQRK